jgi:hypothetical protein
MHVKLADTARRMSMDVVDVYSVKHPTSFASQQPAVLLEIGKIVKAQLKNIRYFLSHILDDRLFDS